jgi:hypothetical protein
LTYRVRRFPHIKGEATMNDRTIPLDAIRALADDLAHDECKHFELAQEHGEDTSNHIYNHVKAVSDWLDTIPGIPLETSRFPKGDFADFWARSGRQV